MSSKSQLVALLVSLLFTYLFFDRVAAFIGTQITSLTRLI